MELNAIGQPLIGESAAHSGKRSGWSLLLGPSGLAATPPWPMGMAL